MQDFVQLWVYLSATPLFGLTVTIVTYALAQNFYLSRGQAPWANPVLWTVVVLDPCRVGLSPAKAPSHGASAAPGTAGAS